MLIVQSSLTPLRRHVDMLMTRWHKLVKNTCDTYRPELHYMRGSGPKWYAKHQIRAEIGVL
jgi:hypothetical protein